MDITKQVTNKDLSQQLEKSGYPQKGVWWWVNCNYPVHFDAKFKYGVNPEGKVADMGFHLRDKEGVEHLKKLPTITNIKYFVAPTVAELGEVLPTTIEMKCWNISMTKKKLKTIYLTQRKHQCWYADEAESGICKTEADSRAKMWLYLKKENLL